jgi:hypothetical protein
MLKPIDFLVGLKILTSKQGWTQMGIAGELCLSSSQVNSAIKQLVESNLFTLRQGKPYPIYAAMKEFILTGMPYCFPAKTAELTVGMPTAYAAEPLSNQITLGNDPIPIWPYAQGKSRGVALEPLHKNVPKALSLFPDHHLYEILVLIDALRIGRAREKKMAQKLLTTKFDEVMKLNEEARNIRSE